MSVTQIRISSLFAIFSVMLTVPFLVSAHTRWFAEGELAPYVTSEPSGLYLTIWAIVAALILVCGIYFERRGTLQLSFLLPRAPHAFSRAAATFSMVAGTFFMIAGTHEYLFSPNLSHHVGIPMFLILLQFGIGLMFLVGVYARVAAFLLGALWVMGFFVAGVEAMLEDIWVLSTALFILIMGNDYFSVVSVRALEPYVRHLKPYALPILRLGTGTTLLVLGFSEKILRPELGINFLQQHDWNFMQMLGFSGYTDYLFVLSAGSVEALFGLIFILGIVTRLNAFVLDCFFTAPLFILGPIELAGHVPHFAAVVLILLFGSGEHFKIARGPYGSTH
ncbi:MAG: hypothetical protein AAB605_00230 [Patescibacteria group bacterium]